MLKTQRSGDFDTQTEATGIIRHSLARARRFTREELAKIDHELAEHFETLPVGSFELAPIVGIAIFELYFRNQEWGLSYKVLNLEDLQLLPANLGALPNEQYPLEAIQKDLEDTLAECKMSPAKLFPDEFDLSDVRERLSALQEREAEEKNETETQRRNPDRLH